MNYLSLIVQLIPLILKLIEFAEKYFTTPGSGADKKAFVIETVKAVYNGAQSVSTGGQAETLDKLEPLLDPVINFGAALLFPSKTEH